MTDKMRESWLRWLGNVLRWELTEAVRAVKEIEEEEDRKVDGMMWYREYNNYEDGWYYKEDAGNRVKWKLRTRVSKYSWKKKTKEKKKKKIISNVHYIHCNFLVFVHINWYVIF